MTEKKQTPAKKFLWITSKNRIMIWIIAIIVIGQFNYNPDFKSLFWLEEKNSYETVNNFIDEIDTSNTIKSIAKDAVSNEKEHNEKIASLWELFIDDSELKNVALLKSLISKLELYKQYNDEYIENMINWYKELWADLDDLSQYSKWERMSKQKELTNYDNYFADKLIKRYKYLLEVQNNLEYWDDWKIYINDDYVLSEYNKIVVEENNVQINFKQKYSDFETYKTEYIRNLSAQ